MAASHVELASAEDALYSDVERQTRGSKRSLRLWAGALVPLLGAAVIVLAITTTRSQIIDTDIDTDGVIEEEMIVSQPPIAQCSKSWTGDKADDCAQTKCCKVTGQSCYQKEPGTFGCLDTCRSDKGWSCRMPGWVVPLSEVKRHSSLDAKFYCFAAYTKETGSTKKSYELELLQGQFQRKLSIFACDYYNVFSDVDAQIGSGVSTIKVTDVDHEFHVVKRKKQGTWVNTAMFKQVWKAIAQKAELTKVQWVVKVDADAVFVPNRLRVMLQGHPVTYTGIYLENCKSVRWGFFGNLEVFSIEAFNTLLANIDSCTQKIDWVKGTEWGPIGEDLFAQMCMDYNGVSKVQNFDLTTDAACPGTRKRWGEKNNTKWKPPCEKLATPAMHPFKKPDDYFNCVTATMNFAA